MAGNATNRRSRRSYRTFNAEYFVPLEAFGAGADEYRFPTLPKRSADTLRRDFYLFLSCLRHAAIAGDEYARQYQDIAANISLFRDDEPSGSATIRIAWNPLFLASGRPRPTIARGVMMRSEQSAAEREAIFAAMRKRSRNYVDEGDIYDNMLEKDTDQ